MLLQTTTLPDLLGGLLGRQPVHTGPETVQDGLGWQLVPRLGNLGGSCAVRG